MSVSIDPLCHDDLTSTSNLHQTARLSALVQHVLEGEDILAVLTTLCGLLDQASKEADIDPVECLCQVLDAVSRGQLDMDAEDIRDIRASVFGPLQ